jgi:hypothetical protein
MRRLVLTSDLHQEQVEQSDILPSLLHVQSRYSAASRNL